MCDPITLAIVGATGGALLSAADSTIDLFGRYSQQEAMNDAIEDAYNQELEMARSQAIIEQQNLNIETQAEQLANRQEERQMEQEAMVSNAAAEAAARKGPTPETILMKPSENAESSDLSEAMMRTFKASSSLSHPSPAGA